ncbi:sigma-E factor negative regulatory protein [Paraherbaspirillum soli]|uniref:Sigma-E factor negative regulatory protein n=1 Tax=Paraherbaspirillum soli TaxID=631222 RepID=A0ABW0MAG9_9BURK
MNTKEMTQEQISALVDGELPSAYVDTALAALRQTEGRETWDVYHKVGDILRSDDMALTMSQDFMSRMMARLDAEPAIVAAPLVAAPMLSEQVAVNGGNVIGSIGNKRAIKRFALPGMAALAAAAAVVFITVPHVAMVNSSTPAAGVTSPQLALASAASVNVPHSGEVLRDPRMDEYLLAHQRFSPSLYSTAQYARSATFAPDADK